MSLQHLSLANFEELHGNLPGHRRHQCGTMHLIDLLKLALVAVPWLWESDTAMEKSRGKFIRKSIGTSRISIF